MSGESQVPFDRKLGNRLVSPVPIRTRSRRCPASVGFHLLLWFEPLGGGTITLDAPFFLAEFNVWVADPVPAGCQQPPSNLAAMPDQGVFWNYVQLGGPAVSNEASDWGAIKSLYR